MVEPYVATVLILVSGFVGLVFAFLYTRETAKISISPDVNDNEPSRKLLVSDSSDVEIENQKTVRKKVFEISQSITEGARSFLFREYAYMGVFVVVFGLIVLIVLGARTKNWYRGVFTATAFVLGCLTSIVSGYIGMEIAVFANSRTALSAQTNIGAGFVVAFKAGAVMGFALVSLGVLMLFVIINLFNLHFTEAYKATPAGIQDTRDMYESIAGYGLGGSSIALFGRVGGGIYTKAADVGADLVGKVEENIPEDDPRNPAVIADNVGDNVGDIAGMGADLFGSFAEASCAAMVVSAQSPELHVDWVAMVFPVTIIATGILVSIVTSFFATHIMVVQKDADIEPSLKRQILISTVLMTPVLFLLSYYLLPKTFHIADKSVKNYYIFFCVSCGLWSGLVIGYITEYYTSKTYTPVQEVSNACRTGAATNIIYGLALGYKSVIIPVFCLAITIYVSYSLAGMYGIAVAALGILSTMAIGLTIDAYGPISDNAGGIAEMSGMGPAIRERTDALDAAGNTTAAIGKGFAIGSAALVSLALFGAFVTTVNLGSVDILQPFEFAGLLVGAMLPYWFSAMTMKSVGKAALAMVQEVRRQFREIPGIRDGSGRPDYKKCVSISTDASLREMLLPGALVMLTPLVVGFLFGIHALAGVLAGALVSGVQMAISCSNTGGAWDNAKKFIEGGGLGPDKGKGSAEHKAAVIGDTVGDPLKDTSGPALNILIKLSAIISLVFASSFPEKGLIEQIFN